MTAKSFKSTIVFRTVKSKTAAAVVAVIAAVALPQLFHVLGRVSDMGTALGETFLPMHLAIFAVGFFAGPVVGAAVGFVSPILSFLLTQMPSSAMLPYMVTELAAYGLFAGLTANVKTPIIVKLLIAQLAGRAVRAAAIIIGHFAFSSPVAVATIWNSVVAGLPGLILQWIILPLAVSAVISKADKE